VYKDDVTGAVIYTAETRFLNADDIIASCPYNVPRKSADGTLAKCDMCNDRVHNGLLPSCVQTCPTGAMNFGDEKEMKALAEKRLSDVKSRYPDAKLLDAEDVRVIYLTLYDPKLYFKYAVASSSDVNLTRHLALKKMFRPLTDIASRVLQA
jgi:formate dehydrogenase iron-sulfur subunit